MDVRNDILSLDNENIEDIALIPKHINRSRVTLKIEKILKRLLDILGGFCGLLVLIPLTIGVWLANKISKDDGPIFYAHERIGQGGKTFKMYKFRSMVVGADEKLKEYLEENEEAREEYKKYKKLKNDPRITKIGKILRKTSLDEFPQFINVLKGDMSLVGPRPYLLREKKEINGFFKYITSCKPGITGLWQTRGRSNTTFTDRLTMDMEYYYNHTLKMDIKLLYKTVRNVVKKEGAI